MWLKGLDGELIGDWDYRGGAAPRGKSRSKWITSGLRPSAPYPTQHVSSKSLAGDLRRYSRPVYIPHWLVALQLIRQWGSCDGY